MNPTRRLAAWIFVAGAASVVAVGLVGPRCFCGGHFSKPAAARARIEILGAALDVYRIDMGRYPSTRDGLDALLRRPDGSNSWQGPYVKKPEWIVDPWDRPYAYRCCPGEHGPYDLWSYGADGIAGGEGDDADITSWRPDEGAVPAGVGGR